LFIAVGTVSGSDAKLHRYVGAFRLDEQQPYVVRMAPDQDGAERRVIVFRLRPDGPVEYVAADRIAPAATTQAAMVPADITSAKMIKPERKRSKNSRRSATPAANIEHREAVLSDQLEAYLTTQQHQVRRIDIRIEGTNSRLLTDLYDATTHVLYELKASSSREAVRMALGQLLDYSRYMDSLGHHGRPRMIAVFPSRPTAELCDLLAEHNIAVAHREGNALTGVPVSALAPVPIA
jgi:hypothetical protein